MKTVAIIGAGPAGITAIKSFVEAGFEVTCFERCDGVGGNWRFDDPSGHSSVFETTHIISSKYTSFYEDFPLPEGTPDYPSHEQLLAYFNAYADRFDLRKHIRFGTEVEHCEPVEGGSWSVRWKSLKSDKSETRVFDALLVCSGHHHSPRMPDYPGSFNGEFLHSHDFKRAAPFAGKRVLVIGGGNSACDVAVETARVSAKTVLSWRRGYYLIPKFVFGLPADKFFYRFHFMPRWWKAWSLTLILRLLQGRNKDIGLPTPTQGVLATHPTLNSELYDAVRHGRVDVVGDIDKLDGDEVVFKDGSRQAFDCVIACTGFRITHPFFDKSVVDFSSPKVRLLHKMIPENLPNLYFIGLFQPLGCIWPGAELQAKLAAKHLAGRWQPAGNLTDLIDKELANPDVPQVNSPRHTITVDDLAFRKRLRRELARATA